MPRRYPPGFGRKVLDLLKAGRSVAELVWDLEISDQTIYNWRRQDLIDTGQVSGVTSAGNGMIIHSGAARRLNCATAAAGAPIPPCQARLRKASRGGLGRPGVAGRSTPAAGLPVFTAWAPGPGPRHEPRPGAITPLPALSQRPTGCTSLYPKHPGTLKQLFGRFLTTTVPVAVFKFTVPPASLKMPPPSVAAMFLITFVAKRFTMPVDRL